MAHNVTQVELASIEDHIGKNVRNKTARPKYAYWILEILKAHDGRGGDIESIAQDLNQFDLNRHRLPKKHRSFGAIKSRQELSVILQILQASGVDRVLPKAPEVVRLYDKGNLLIIIPLTKAASNQYASHTKLCIGAGKAINRFDYYNDQAPLILVIDKKKNEKYCLHFLTQQYKDSLDRPVTLAVLFADYPELQAVTQSYMLGALEHDLSLIDYLDHAHYVNPESYAVIFQQAVARSYWSLLHVMPKYLPSGFYDAICHHSVTRDGWALEYVRPEHLCDREFYAVICKIAVADYGLGLQYVQRGYLPSAESYDEIYHLAIRQNPKAEKYGQKA